MSFLTTKLALGLICALSAVGFAWSLPNAPETPLAPIVTMAPKLPTTTMAPIKVTSCTQAGIIAATTGWTQEQQVRAMMIAARESRCNQDAFNAFDSNGGSAGIYQINYFWCKPSAYWPQGWLQAQGILTTCRDLFDPWINTRAAYAIYKNSGWAPWGM